MEKKVIEWEYSNSGIVREWIVNENFYHETEQINNWMNETMLEDENDYDRLKKKLHCCFSLELEEKEKEEVCVKSL